MPQSVSKLVSTRVADDLLRAGFHEVPLRGFVFDAPDGGMVAFETRSFPLKPDRFLTFWAEVFVLPDDLSATTVAKLAARLSVLTPDAVQSNAVGRDERSGDTELLGNRPWRRGCRYGWTVSAGVP